jgi:hypothetical protein
MDRLLMMHMSKRQIDDELHPQHFQPVQASFDGSLDPEEGQLDKKENSPKKRKHRTRIMNIAMGKIEGSLSEKKKRTSDNSMSLLNGNLSKDILLPQ